MLILTLLLVAMLSPCPAQARDAAQTPCQAASPRGASLRGASLQGASLQGASLVERAAAGQVDWGSGLVRAGGTAPGGALSCPEATALATRGAQAALAQLLRGVVLASGRTVGSALQANPAAAAEFANIVRSAQVVDRKFYSDGGVEVAAALSMRGGFLQLVLPPEVTSIAPVQQVTYCAARAGARYSGLVVDARGLGVRPALCPRLLSEDGTEVFGPAFVSREAAVQRGVAAYATALPDKAGGRAGATPLLVRGLRASGASRCDVVISHADAQKLRSAPESADFLQHCRVLIVVN